jgi:hypothetical protein
MKENTLFKLDLLQTYYLQKPARFGVTKQMMRSEKYQLKKSNQSLSTNSKRVEKQKHKLLQLTRNEAFEMIKKLQCEVFEKKIHFFEIALNRAMIKVLKKERQKLIPLQSEKDEKLKNDLNEKIKVIDSIINKNNSIVLQNNIKHKILKILIKTFPDKFDVKNDKFEGIPENYIDYLKNMKENNPYKGNGDILNNLLSKIYADKSIKEIIENISSLELVWGPKKYSKNNDEGLKEFEEDNESENEVGISGMDSDNEEVEQEKGEFDEDYEKLYEGYKDYIVASSDEEDGDGDENDKGNNNDNTGFILDPSINYNEITDEEPSDDDEFDENLQQEDIKIKESKRSLEDDDFFAQEQEPDNKKSKRATMKDIQLPALAVGYYSGGESDEETKDSLVDEITTTRKNRRGQRARQKIWEKKYGKGAKHVVKEQQRDKSERERLRLEYEARKIKREEKEREREQREQEREEKKKKQQEKTLHPSWEAKIKAQESLKKAKFQGKKITFD